MIDLTPRKELGMVIAVMKKGGNRQEMFDNLDELILLADTAGVEVIEKNWQEVEQFKRSTLIGKGKVEEFKELIDKNKIEIAIFDDDLSPMQARNLEAAFNVKVIDRSGLILDIFAKRAKTSEAITQVELAQMQYLLPRLTRLWTHLSKQYGGVGTKGPGETQIETDRRLVRHRIDMLKDKLSKIEQKNEQKRKSRENMPKFGLVGYTNAGKSTLMKAITESDVYIKDELFATLDTTVRSFELPSGKKAILSDTVGFIRKLPTHLIASFRSTLAEAKLSDFLLHVIDVSHFNWRLQYEAVNETLTSLGIIPESATLIFNKVDKIADSEIIYHLQTEFPNAIFISASKGFNIELLKGKMQEMYESQAIISKVLIPWENSNRLGEVYQYGEVLETVDTDTGSIMTINVTQDKATIFANKFKDFMYS